MQAVAEAVVVRNDRDPLEPDLLKPSHDRVSRFVIGHNLITGHYAPFPFFRGRPPMRAHFFSVALGYFFARAFPPSRANSVRVRGFFFVAMWAGYMLASFHVNC